MAYYNSYQQSYNPYSQQQPQQGFNQNFQQPMPNQMSMSPMNMQTSGINWVQGDIGARAFPVGPGNSVILMDSEGDYFYIKSADMSGMPSMKRYSYSEVVDEPMRLESHDNRDFDTAKFADREEVKKLQEEIRELKNQIATMEVDSRNKQQGRQNGGKQNG